MRLARPGRASRFSLGYDSRWRLTLPLIFRTIRRPLQRASQSAQMSKLHVYFDPADAPRIWLDPVIEVLLAALLLFCPLALGVVEAWSEQVVIALTALIALCLALK